METQNQPYTVEDEISDFLRINKLMLKDTGTISLLEYEFLTGYEFHKALLKDNNECGENIKNLYREKVEKSMLMPRFRALRRFQYDDIPIFKEVNNIIDEALESFFMQNYICAYISLIPVVEGLLLRWENKKKTTTVFDFRESIKSKVAELKAKEIDAWGKSNLELLEDAVCNVFFERSNEVNIESMFNRNVILHLLNNLNDLQSKTNALRVLAIIDLISICYKIEKNLSENREAPEIKQYEEYYETLIAIGALKKSILKKTNQYEQ